MSADIWTYRSDADFGVGVSRGVDLTGFAVEALYGRIGKIDEATRDQVGAGVRRGDPSRRLLPRQAVEPHGLPRQ